ncbi:hypothetical protein HFD88_005944 [Aspergillus terreus]|nr:hypothetical protein HFD88_005944 [Aspergillus terreus]
MDPFSMAVGCVSLLDVITRLSLSVTDFIVNFRDARADLATVADELSDLNLNVQILKADTKRKPSYEVPKDLRQYICEVMEHCKTDLTTFETLLKGYENEGLNRVKWAISGRIEAQKIHTSLAAHKAALNLAAETVSL